MRGWTSPTDSRSQHVTLVHSLPFPGFRHGSRKLVTRLLPGNVGIKQSDADPWRGPRQPWSSGLAPASSLPSLPFHPCPRPSPLWALSKIIPFPCLVSRFGPAVRRSAGKQRDLDSNPLPLSFFFKICGLWTLFNDFVPHS